jgi:hypothetical protein
VGNSEDDLLLAVFAHLGLVLPHLGRSHGSVGTSYLVKKNHHLMSASPV